jgi:hypothetical protein
LLACLIIMELVNRPSAKLRAALARAEALSGNVIGAENYYQHAAVAA